MDFNKFLNEFEKLIPKMYPLFNNDKKVSTNFFHKVINAVKSSPELLRCGQDSLMGSIMFFADINLPFNTPEGYGYVVNINGNATPIIGYKGLIEIAYRNKELKQIRMASVFKDDIFEYQMGTDEYIKHIPALTKTGTPIAAYAVAHIQGLNPFFTVITKQDLDRIAESSLIANTKFVRLSALDVNHVMQAKATVKQLFKTLPKGGNEKLIEVMDVDNKLDFDKSMYMSINNGRYVIVTSKISQVKDVPAPEIVVKKSEKKISEEQQN